MKTRQVSDDLSGLAHQGAMRLLHDLRDGHSNQAFAWMNGPIRLRQGIFRPAAGEMLCQVSDRVTRSIARTSTVRRSGRVRCTHQQSGKSCGASHTPYMVWLQATPTDGTIFVPQP
jgi:hypothetical protein